VPVTGVISDFESIYPGVGEARAVSVEEEDEKRSGASV
jgi:hypothetical protein